MNVLMLRNMQMRKSASLQSFREYRASEAQNPNQASVTQDGVLLEYETLELRLHPPNVQIDNDTYDDVTVITIDSANRPGTLIEVVQCLTELNLSIRRARISSDGGWFVDEFYVTETPKGKVVDPRKLNLIKQVLSIEGTTNLQDMRESAVFELAGRDQRGLMAQVLQLLAANGCEVQSAAVWTYHNQVAFVVNVIDVGVAAQTAAAAQAQAAAAGGPGARAPGLSASSGGAPSSAKLITLQEVLYGMLGGGGALVRAEVVRGEVHHERRLHHLLLLEELKAWRAQTGGTAAAPASGTASAGGATDAASAAKAPASPAAAAAGGGGGVGEEAGPVSRAASPAPVDGPASSAGPAEAGARGATPAPVGRVPSANGLAPAGLESGEGSGLQHVLSASSLGGASLTGDAGGEDGTGPGGRSGTPPLGSEGGAPTSTLGPGSTLTAGGQYVRSTGGAVQGGNMYDGAPASAAQLAPAPTAMAPSDLLNNYSVMDPSNVAVARLLSADVRIQHSALLKYHLVTITCKDRNKLFFDTVCTLADMNYDVYHGTIDSEGDSASQLFYVRPRYGECVWDEAAARRLAYMLECAVQRRFPRGLRLMAQAPDRGTVPALFAALAAAGLWVTRAEVRSLPGTASGAVFDFSVTDATGRIPPPAAVLRACEAAGGTEAEGELEGIMTYVASAGGAAVAAVTARPGVGGGSMLSGGQGMGMGMLGAGGGGSILAGRHLQGGAGGGAGGPTASIPSGRFAFVFAGSADKRRGPLGSATSTQSSMSGVL